MHHCKPSRCVYIRDQKRERDAHTLNTSKSQRLSLLHDNIAANLHKYSIFKKIRSCQCLRCRKTINYIGARLSIFLFRIYIAAAPQHYNKCICSAEADRNKKVSVRALGTFILKVRALATI
jgi:hypothetical protein